MEDEREVPTASGRRARARRRILVVDSDPVRRAELAALLNRQGQHVVHAGSASEVRALPDVVFDDLYVGDPNSAESITLSEMLRRHNPLLQTRSLPSRGADSETQVEPTTVFQFLFDLWHGGLSLIDEDWARNRNRARDRAELARGIAQELGLPAASVDQIYLGAYIVGMDPLLRKAEIGGGGLTPTRALLNEANCPYDLEGFFSSLPETPVASASLPLDVRVAAAAESYLAAEIPGGLSAAETIYKLRWGYEAPDLAGALLRTLARRGEIVLPDSPRGSEVLVIDPDRVAAATLWLRFVADGAGVRVFSDGAAALEHLRSYGAGLVISETDVPSVDGLRLCRELKENESTRHVKFFFLSKDSAPDRIMLGLECGAEDYLVKPANLELLAVKARRALAE